MRANDGVCSVEIAANHQGFFAQMLWCLHILQYCERSNLVPDIRLTGDIYLDRERGPDWLAYYFDVNQPINSSTKAVKRVRYTKKISAWREMGPPIVPRMSLADSTRVFNKYFRPKPHIVKMVDDFWQSVGTNGPAVGVHYRGTDKSTEAPRVSWQHCLRVLDDYLCNHPATKAVFVASDEQDFVDFMRESVKEVPIYSHSDHYRSSDDQPIHLTSVGSYGYEKGEDALVNALLLAKCTTLIRTTSFLSAWASIFNPDLKVILLNKPYSGNLWYPESEIVRKIDTEYLPERLL